MGVANELQDLDLPGGKEGGAAMEIQSLPKDPPPRAGGGCGWWSVAPWSETGEQSGGPKGALGARGALPMPPMLVGGWGTCFSNYLDCPKARTLTRIIFPSRRTACRGSGSWIHRQAITVKRGAEGRRAVSGGFLVAAT